MANLLQYTDKSKTIDNKLNSLLSQINYDYKNGNIRTETEYYYRIKNMLTDFYKSLTKPSFIYRPAVSTPISSEYNAMIQESYNDMEYIIKDCEALNVLVSQSFIDAELSRDMLTNEVAYLSKKISSIGDSIAANQPDGTVIYTESFTDLETVGNENDEKRCYVNTSDGILTLRPGFMKKILIDEVTIDNEFSNGFPGNSHCVDTLNNSMHFIGQEGLNNNPAHIIDSNSDTWFEYELFQIDDSVRQATNSYGFEFDEGISWISDDDVLRLKVIFNISNTNQCSWISLNPYMPNIKGVKNCILESCEVISTNNNVYKIAGSKVFDKNLIFPFPAHTIKQVRLTFAQPSKYLTKVGHFYYTAANTSDMSIFQNYDYTDIFARVDGKKPSISLLGCKYNPQTQWITYPTNNTEFVDGSYAKDKLFSLPESTISTKANQEIIDAYRYMIGIRNVSLVSYEFIEYGEYVSTIYATDEIITSISLEADEYIPGKNPDILRYYISVNGGLNWHRIYPRHRAYDGIYKYYVNNDTIENMLASDNSIKKSKNLSVIGECKSVQLKIEMERPVIDNCLYSTPIVYQYKLKLTTGGDTIEY